MTKKIILTTAQKEQIKKRHRDVVNKQYKIVRIKKDTDTRLQAYKAAHRLSSLDNAIQHLLDK